jgi:AraC family transcriptional regulator
MEVRIETVPPRRVAFMRHIGPYREVGTTWAKLMAWAGPRGLLGPQMVALGVAHDDPDVTPLDKLRYDACIAVEGSFTPEGEVGVQEVGGGEYAITTHRGPYEAVAQTLARLCGEWLPASGRELRSAPTFGIFRNSLPDTPDQDLLTDLYMPLE